jgi:MerR family transcriptional regulator, thiopeptide resistance regulator
MSTPAATVGASGAVIPVLVYEDIEAAQDFLVAAFGFAPGGLHRDDDGAVVHGEVRHRDSPIWLHRVTTEHGLDSPTGSPATHGGLEVLVEDVDAHYTRSAAAGARIDRAPTDQAYGLREYGARDPEGPRWWFASPSSGDGGPDPRDGRP